MDNNIKITKRDNYNTLRTLVTDSNLPTDTCERLTKFIDHEIDLLTARAAKSQKYQQEHRINQDDPMTKAIQTALAASAEPMSVSDLVKCIDGSTNQKLVYRLGKLFKNGYIAKDAYPAQQREQS